MKAKKVLAGLALQQANGTLCDIQLKAEQQTIPAHKGVLAAATPYFEAMFTGNFDETKAHVVEIKDVTFTGLKNVVQSIYTDKIDINAENVADILPAAHLLQMADIVKDCQSWMKKRITKNNCFDFLRLAEKYNIESVEAAVMDFILKNFSVVSDMDSFMEISQQALCRYLSSDVLKSEMNEYSVYKATKKWILKNNIKDVALICEIMSNIRFGLIPATTLSGQVLLDDLIDGNKPFRIMVAEAMQYHTDVYSQPFYEGNLNRPRGKQGMLVIPNGSRHDGSYSADNNGQIDFLPIPALKPARRSTSLNIPMVYDSMEAVRISNFLFLFGCTSDGYQNMTMRYDASNDSWMTLEHVPRDATVGSKVACSEDKKQVFLIGGMKVNATMKFELCADNVITNTYIYDIPKNGWSTSSDLPQALAYAGVASLGSFVYVTGGYTAQETTTDSVYAYDIKGKLWLTKARMNEKRCAHTLDAIKDKLYTIGGRNFDGGNVLSNEIYDTLSNQWTLLAPQGGNGPFCACSSFVNGTTMYIIGGTKKEKMIHMYEVDKNRVTVSGVELPSHCVRNVSALLTLPKLL